MLNNSNLEQLNAHAHLIESCFDEFNDEMSFEMRWLTSIHSNNNPAMKELLKTKQNYFLKIPGNICSDYVNRIIAIGALDRSKLIEIFA